MTSANYKSEARNRRLHSGWILAIVVFVVVGGLLAYSFAEPFWIETKEVTYASTQVPPEFDGVRIVFLTDIHHGLFFSQDRVKKLVKRVNDMQPDIIALGGDYVERNTDNETSCFVELAKLSARLGRYAVLGNHDYGAPTLVNSSLVTDPSVASKAIEDAGIQLLDNAALWIELGEARIRLGGVSDCREGRPLLAPTVADVAQDELVILLSHNPAYAEQLPTGAVDLMLSGHNHGGQITFFGLWAPRLPSGYGQKYRTGVVRTGSTTVVLSNGIGTTFPPMRFFARPQIIEITLRHIANAG